MTACNHCGIPVEPVVIGAGEQGVEWVHLTDRSPWCRTTRAEPDGTYPPDDEIRELLDLGWTVIAIARRWRCDRTRLARWIRQRGLDRPTTGRTTAA